MTRITWLLLGIAAILAHSPHLLSQAASQEELILERGNKLLEEAKAAYEAARTGNSVAGFIDAGFKLEEARIKFIVLQEISTGDKQRLAADRLREINQLGKLIHDGKVAISGKAVEEPSPKPAAAPNPAEPAPPPALPAPPAGVRRPVPEAARQRDVEKQVKELYKEQYLKKLPAERGALARELLDLARKSSEDPALQWVLLREAQDLAAQAADAGVAVQAAEAQAVIFDIDGLAARNAALSAVAKTTRTPEENTALTKQLLKLSDEMVAVDDYVQAEKAAAAAVQASRRSADPALLARANARVKLVADARLKFEGMKKSLDALARNSDDPAANQEIGLFLCLVKSNWDLGLRFLVKGSDASLKALAGKDLAMPLQASDQTAVGDGWWDLAEKEKSPLRKEKLLERARYWYLSALPQAPPLLRVKIEKRTGQGIEGPVDVLKVLDLKQDALEGEWSLASDKLSCTKTSRCARVQIPLRPPDEYDVTVVANRVDGNEAFVLGLVQGGAQFNAVVDGFNSSATGLCMMDGKHIDANESTYRGSLLKNGKASTIVCSVRRDGVTMTCDGKKVISWKGEFSRLTAIPGWGVPSSQILFFGCCDSKIVISKFILTPVSTGTFQKQR